MTQPQGDIPAVLLLSTVPAGLNLAHVTDLITAISALLGIGFTIYRFAVALRAKRKDKNGNTEKK